MIPDRAKDTKLGVKPLLFSANDIPFLTRKVVNSVFNILSLHTAMMETFPPSGMDVNNGLTKHGLGFYCGGKFNFVTVGGNFS